MRLQRSLPNSRRVVIPRTLFCLLLSMFASRVIADEPRPLLGVKAGDLAAWIESQEESLLSEMSYPVTAGVIITSVVPGSPADKTGLQANDILVSGGKTDFRSHVDFLDWLKTTKDGELYPLTIWRREDNGNWSRKRVG